MPASIVLAGCWWALHGLWHLDLAGGLYNLTLWSYHHGTWSLAMVAVILVALTMLAVRKHRAYALAFPNENAS